MNAGRGVGGRAQHRLEAPLGTPLEPGGFAVVETTPPLLAQVTACELGVRDLDGGRAHVLEGTATALGGGPGGFSDLPIAKAPPEAVAAWAAERLDPEGLHLGALVDAPATHALLDARGLARHTFLCGQSGSGKTYTTGVLLEQVLRQTRLRLIVLDPNSDHVGLREAREDADPAVAERHRARAAALHIARADEGLPFATTSIGLRFSNFSDAAQALILRLDPIGDADEVEALLDVTSKLPAPYEPADVAAAAGAVDTPAARRLAGRIRALGIADWHLWQRDPAQRVLGDLAGTGEGIVIDTGSMADPAERSAIAAAVTQRHLGAAPGTRSDARRARRGAPHLPRRAARSDPGRRHGARRPDRGRRTEVRHLPARRDPAAAEGAPSVVAGCESLVLLRMNSLRDVRELEAAFSHIPEGLLRLAPGFVRGEALVGGALAPAPLHLRVGGRITPEGGGDVPTTWARPPEQTPADVG